MKTETIKQLNQLNQNFYQQQAQHFSDTRDVAWPGWQELLPLLQDKNELLVLDIGCGNGRFGRFLADTLPHTKLGYTGIDYSQNLLDIADQLLKTKVASYDLKKADIVLTLLKLDEEILFPEPFDLIVAFGVLHHIPSAKLRQKFMSYFLKNLAPGGVMVVTLWQFMNSSRQKQKVVDPQTAKITDELEANDYIMSWDNQTTSYRYVHHFTESEIAALIPENGFTITQFKADGKEQNLNHYLVITKQ